MCAVPRERTCRPGQLHTDQEAPANLRSAAQGLITFLTYGLGMFIGSFIAGNTVDYFTVGKAAAARHDWHAFWMSSAVSAFLILLLIAVFFRSQSKIQSKTGILEADSDNFGFQKEV